MRKAKRTSKHVNNLISGEQCANNLQDSDFKVIALYFCDHCSITNDRCSMKIAWDRVTLDRISMCMIDYSNHGDYMLMPAFKGLVELDRLVSS